MNPLVRKFVSRKFLLTLAAVFYSVIEHDPKYGAIASAVYVVIQGWIDKHVADPTPVAAAPSTLVVNHG